MKYIIVLSLVVTFHSHQSLSQVVLLDRAYDLIQSKDYVKAKEALERAEKHVTTAHDPRTFYLKAFVYKELFLQSSGNERSVNQDALVSNAFHCRDLDAENNFKKPLEELIDFAAAGIFNDASKKFNDGNFVEAVRLYKKYASVTRQRDNYWLEANYFIGASYSALNAIDSAITYLEFARKRNYSQPVLYVDLTYIYLNMNRLDEALTTIQQGLALFPDYYDLQIAQINALLKVEQFDTMEYVVEEFLRHHPDEVDVLLMAGTVYERNRNSETDIASYEKAERVYKRVIAIDPDNFDANYNLGVLYYNEAVEIVNRNGIDTDIDELTKVLERSTQLFEYALPLLQSIFDQQKNNSKLLHALQAIYYNLNMKAELAEINSLIKALGKT